MGQTTEEAAKEALKKTEVPTPTEQPLEDENAVAVPTANQ